MFDAVHEEWHHRPLSEIIESLEAGVSVNSDGRQVVADEFGVLKTSCVSGGVFRPHEHKAILDNERQRARVSVEANSIILSRMNTLDLVGANAFVDRDYPNLFLPDRLWLLKTNNRADCRWLSFYMQSETFRSQIADIATGTSGSMKNISKGRLADLPILLPPLDEQRRMAEVLLSVDEAIAQTKEVVSGLDAAINGITEAHFLSDEFQCYRLGSLARFVGSGVTPKGGKQSYPASGIPFLRSQNIHFDGLRLDGLAFIAQNTHQQMARTQVQPKDVLLNITGASIGRCTYMPTTFGPANVNQHVCIIRTDDQQILPEYLAIFLSSYQGQRQIDQLQSGLSREGLNFQQVRSMQLPLPTIAQQTELVRIVSALRSSREANRNDCEAKIALKASLASDLLSGRVRVPA